MRRHLIGFFFPLISIAGLVAGIAGTASAAGDWTGHVNFMIGQSYLGDGKWGSLDRQDAFGLEIDFRNRDWPVNIAIDMVGCTKEEDSLVPGTGRVIRQSADISELDLGVRKFLDQGPFFHPFVGGGIALAAAERQILGTEYDGDGVGLWLDAGISLAVTSHFNVGVELRYSWAEVDLGPERINTGGVTAGALFGFRW